MTDSPALFLDRSLGGRVVAGVLREVGFAVEIHDDHFPQDAPDDVWLPEVSQRGWIALTKDNRIRRRTIQRLMVAQCGARLFALTSGEMSGADIGAALARLVPRIQRLAERQPRPFIATVQASGRIQLWRDRGALLAELERLRPRLG